MIQDLLTDAGAHQLVRQLSTVDGRGIEAAADWPQLKSPENYLGHSRTENFESPGGARSGRHTYTLPRKLGLNQWALEGEWTVESEHIRLDQPNGRIACGFHSRDVHLVMGPPSGTRTVRFRLLLDGQPPGTARGLDADEQGNGVASDQRLYQLIRQPKPIVDRVVQIEFLDPGVEAFAFTFG